MRRRSHGIQRRWAAAALVFAFSVAAGAGYAGLPPAAARSVQRAFPVALAASPDGRHLYVAESGLDSVAEIDTARRAVTRRLRVGGSPVAIALSGDGRRLVCCIARPSSLTIIGLPGGAIEKSLPLPGSPQAIRIAPEGDRAYVALSTLNSAVAVKLATSEVVGSAPVGRRPVALDLDSDGARMVVASAADGTLSIIETESMRETDRFKLKGINARGVRLTPGGTEAYAVCMPAFNQRPAAESKELWHNLIQGVSLDVSPPRSVEDQWIDFSIGHISGEILGEADPMDLVINSDATIAWIAVGGRDVVTRISIHDRRRTAIWPFFQDETPVGANPRALALSPDGKTLWVACMLDDTIRAVDAVRGTELAVIRLAESPVDEVLRGLRLFYSAAHSPHRRFSCASCHPDGASDGLTWRFVHVSDGVEQRNTRDLRGGILATGPFRWSGHDERVAAFVADEIRGLFAGPPLPAPDVAALSEALDTLRMPENPHRSPGGGMSPEARSGGVVFNRAGCGQCHAGSRGGGTGLRADVGTGGTFDVPHLTGLFDGAPYLHDGRARTIGDIMTQPGLGVHQDRFRLLSPGDQSALIRYLFEF